MITWSSRGELKKKPIQSIWDQRLFDCVITPSCCGRRVDTKLGGLNSFFYQRKGNMKSVSYSQRHSLKKHNNKKQRQLALHARIYLTAAALCSSLVCQRHIAQMLSPFFSLLISLIEYRSGLCLHIFPSNQSTYLFQFC